MIVVNFTRHQATPAQEAEIKALLGRSTRDKAVTRIVELPQYEDGDLPGDHIFNDRPLAPQVSDLVARFGLSETEWQTALIIPPSLAPVAAVLMSELHGRLGHFPPIIRIQPVPGSVPRRYEAAEIIDLQAVRDTAR